VHAASPEKPVKAGTVAHAAPPRKSSTAAPRKGAVKATTRKGVVPGKKAGTATIPQSDPDPKARAAAVAERAAGFIYGPSLIGEAAFFPNGTLGNKRTQDDMDLWAKDREMIDGLIAKDVASIQAALQAVSFLTLA
jgi:hypothetical protein